MSWVLLILATLGATELLVALPVISNFKGASLTAQKSTRLIAKKGVSDHWKELVLPRYARALATHSILGLVFLILALVPFALFALFNSGPLSADMAFLTSLPAIVVMLACSLGYLWLRTRMRKSDSSSDYSPMDKVLHQLALGNGAVAEMTHDLDKAQNLKSSPPFEGSKPVFVCGLARAGTTVILRELYGSGQFSTLTYRDMPFVMAPNLWAKLSGNRSMETSERAHGDGIEVGLESPEALDEVYWRLMDGAAYIKPDHLRPHAPNAETIEGYADYARLIMKRGKAPRYLSKNNNTILRIPALAKAFPDATFLVPLRDPLQHSLSLLSQHKRFSESDAFTQKYMTWLGHHEFGATHRPFRFTSEAAHGDPETLDYWLKLWIAAHTHLEGIKATHPDQVLFISNETLGQDADAWLRLCGRLGLQDAKPLAELRSIAPRATDGFDPDLAKEAAALYARLPQFSG